MSGQVDLRQGEVGHGGLLPVCVWHHDAGPHRDGPTARSDGGLQVHRSRGCPIAMAVDGRSDRAPGSSCSAVRRPDRPAVEVLLAHPGGPFFATRDEGHWSIPKGEPDAPDEDLLAVARREFAEEVGIRRPRRAGRRPPIELGTIVQKGGKVVHAWAIEGDLDPAAAVSNTFEMEWPPRSGRRQDVPGDRSRGVVRARTRRGAA